MLNYQQRGQNILSLSSWCWLLKMPSNHADQLQVGKQPAQARKQVNNRSPTHSNKTQERDSEKLGNKWGQVERANTTLKETLAKICADTKLTWLDAVPIALASLRCTVSRMTGFTPFLLCTSRQFPKNTVPNTSSGITWCVKYHTWVLLSDLTALVAYLS